MEIRCGCAAALIWLVFVYAAPAAVCPRCSETTLLAKQPTEPARDDISPCSPLRLLNVFASFAGVQHAWWLLTCSPSRSRSVTMIIFLQWRRGEAKKDRTDLAKWLVVDRGTLAYHGHT